MSRPTCDTCQDSGVVVLTPDSGTYDVRAAHPDDPRAVPCIDCVTCPHCLERHDVNDECPTCNAALALECGRAA